MAEHGASNGAENNGESCGDNSTPNVDLDLKDAAKASQREKQSPAGVDPKDTEGAELVDVAATAAPAESTGHTEEGSDSGPIAARPRALPAAEPKAVNAIADGTANGPQARVREKFDELREAKRVDSTAAKRLLEEVTVELRRVDTPAELSTSHCAWIDTLGDEHALVLSCESSDVLDSALYKVTQHLRFTGHRKCVLQLRRPETQGPTPTCDEFAFELCLLPSVHENEPNFQGTLLVVLALSSPWAKPFIEDVFRDETIGWQQRKSELRIRKRCVLVLTRPSIVPPNEFRSGRSGIPSYTIGFQQALIESYCGGDQARASKLVEAFHRLTEGGVWGKSAHEQCKELESLVAERTLEQAISSGPQPRQEVADWLGSDVLVDSALFIATFFPELSVDDFQQLLLWLVEGKQVESAAGNSDQPAAEAKPANPPVSLEARWKRERATLLRHCGLKVVERGPSSSGTLLLLADREAPVVDFARYGMNSILKSQFRTDHRFFYVEAFEALERHGMVLHPRWDVFHSFAVLAADMAASNPDKYGPAWLLSLVFSAGPSMDRVVVADGSQASQFRKALAFHQARHGFIYDRLCGLMEEMLTRQVTTRVVDSTLGFLLQEEFFDAVIQLVRRLSRTPGFEPMRWLRKVVDRHPATIEEALQLLRDHKLRASSTLLATRSWVLDNPAKDSPAATLALKLAVSLGWEAVRSASVSVGVAGYPILVGTTLTSSDVRNLVEWLFHDQINAYLTRHNVSEDLLPYLLGCWFLTPEICGLLEQTTEQLLGELLTIWFAAFADLATSPNTHASGSDTMETLFQAAVLHSQALLVSESSERDPQPALVAVLAQYLSDRTQSRIWQRLTCLWNAIESCLRATYDALDRVQSERDSGARGKVRELKKSLKARRERQREFRSAVKNCMRSSHGRSN